jgi:hypothetical protein
MTTFTKLAQEFYKSCADAGIVEVVASRIKPYYGAKRFARILTNKTLRSSFDPDKMDWAKEQFDRYSTVKEYHGKVRSYTRKHTEERKRKKGYVRKQR